MKKYLMTAATALVLGGLMTSCTKDLDSGGSSSGLSDNPLQNYEQAFLNTFGRPVDGFDWGFGPGITASTRAFTRVFDDRPEAPTFRDGETINNKFVLPITEPEVPSFYKTFEEVEDAKIVYAKNVEWNNGWDAVSAAYIDENCNILRPERTDGKTFYVHGNVTYEGGVGNGNNNQPVIFVVLEGSTLHLGSVGLNMRIYLAPNATLDVTKFETFELKNSSVDARNAFLYLSKSSHVIGNDLYFFNGCDIRNDGGTITADNLEIDKQTTIWNKGTIAVDNELKLTNENAYIYNADNNKVSAKNLSLTNNYDLIYNVGTLDISKDIFITNSSAEIVNNDSLTCSGDLKMTAGGKFHNVGITDITGETYIYNTNAAWMNDGHYTTGSFKDMNCQQVYNNCHMTVTGNFYLGSIPNSQNQEKLGTSNFVNNGGEGEGISGAYVSAGSFTFGDDAQLWLGNKSFIEVDEEFKSTNDDKPYGIHGPSSGSYAVIKAAEFSKEGNPYISMTYYGKLFIDTPIHYPKGTDSANPYYEIKGEDVLFSFNHPEKPVSIPKTDCSPGYNGGGGGSSGGGGDSNIVRVIAEDLTLVDTKKADFDFNDVVFDVEWAGSNIKITIQAAGGTLPLTVGDTEAADDQSPTMEKRTDSQGAEIGDDVIKYEVHKLFKVSTGTMVNTHATAGGVDNKTPVSFTIANPYPSSSDLKVIANYIPIRVYKGGKWVPLPVATTVDQSDELTACKVAVDASYGWCNERDHIDTVYPYIDKYGNNIGSCFRFYLNGDLTDQWWKETTKLSDDN